MRTGTGPTMMAFSLQHLRSEGIRFLSRVRSSEQHAVLLLAAGVGILGAFATMAFRVAVDYAQWLLTGRHDTLVEMARHLSPSARVLIPVVGGLLAGALLWLQRKRHDSTGIDYMEAIAGGDGRIPIRASLLRSTSSLCTIVTGGSIGREGAMIQLAALSASILGRCLKLGRSNLRTLVACGAAAGVASAYSAPLAGAVFVCEIVLGSIASDRFVPILMASVVSNITVIAVLGYHPPYILHDIPVLPIMGMIWFLPLGLLAGLCTPIFLRLLAMTRFLFDRSGLTPLLSLAVGGLGVGLLSLQAPEVWGNGYEVVNAVLHTPWPAQALVSILLFKLLATALTTGSGAIGGIFTPSLFVGAMLGCLYGVWLQQLRLENVATPQIYAVIGMGAFLAASSRAPLMSILMIFEMT